MKNTQPRPDWAPDECPDNVVQLVKDEQFLDRMQLRGLASGDSSRVHAAIVRLEGVFDQTWRRGLRTGVFLGALSGIPLGVVAAYVALAL